MAVITRVEKCLNPNTEVTADKCLWRFDSSIGAFNNGWVFVGCNCAAGKCCEPPPMAIVPDGTEEENDCIDCPPPPAATDLPTSAGPPDEEPEKKS
jgi:hypothetical protein